MTYTKPQLETRSLRGLMGKKSGPVTCLCGSDGCPCEEPTD